MCPRCPSSRLCAPAYRTPCARANEVTVALCADVLGAKEVERRARLRKLKDEFRDVCKNSDAQKSGKAGVGGSVPPNLVRLRAEVKKVEAAFKHCLGARRPRARLRHRPNLSSKKAPHALPLAQCCLP